MRPSELKILASEMIKARKPLLVTGAPGIGKSNLIEDAARMAQADLILSHPVVSDPTDQKGLPAMVDGRAEFLPFGDLRQAMQADKLTVWFFDDLGQASPAVQASCMQLFLARQINGHRLSDHVTFIAATNRRVDRAGVTGILEPVKSRFASIVELEANSDDWTQWANEANMPPELVAFIRFRPDLLSKFEPTADLTNSPVPRTWAHVADLLAMSLPRNVLQQTIHGAVGAGAATEFLSYLDMYRQLPNIDQILKDGKATTIPEKPAVLYAIVSALAHKADAKNFAQIAVYIDRLMKEGHGEFGVLCLKDSMTRKPEVKTSPAFVKMVTGELGSLITGM